MKPGGGKAKGGEFERSVCKALSLWVSKGQNVDLYWRSALSGGRATVAKGAVRQGGDITAVAPEGHVLTDQFYLELKHYKKLSIDCFLKGKGPLLDIWNTTVKEATKYNRIPVLIYKQNNWPTIFCTSPQGVQQLKAELLVLVEACYGPGICLIPFDTLLKNPFPL